MDKNQLINFISILKTHTKICIEKKFTDIEADVFFAGKKGEEGAGGTSTKNRSSLFLMKRKKFTFVTMLKGR